MKILFSGIMLSLVMVVPFDEGVGDGRREKVEEAGVEPKLDQATAPQHPVDVPTISRLKKNLQGFPRRPIDKTLKVEITH